METVEGAVREDVRPRESMEAARHSRKREQHVSSPKTGLSLADLTYRGVSVVGVCEKNG